MKNTHKAGCAYGAFGNSRKMSLNHPLRCWDGCWWSELQTSSWQDLILCYAWLPGVGSASESFTAAGLMVQLSTVHKWSNKPFRLVFPTKQSQNKLLDLLKDVLCHARLAQFSCAPAWGQGAHSPTIANAPFLVIPLLPSPVSFARSYK